TRPGHVVQNDVVRRRRPLGRKHRGRSCDYRISDFEDPSTSHDPRRQYLAAQLRPGVARPHQDRSELSGGAARENRRACTRMRRHGAAQPRGACCGVHRCLHPDGAEWDDCDTAVHRGRARERDRRCRRGTGAIARLRLPPAADRSNGTADCRRARDVRDTCGAGARDLDRWVHLAAPASPAGTAGAVLRCGPRCPAPPRRRALLRHAPASRRPLGSSAMPDELSLFQTTGASWSERARLGELDAVLTGTGNHARNLFLHHTQLVAARYAATLVPRTGRVVDFGCGTGRFMRFFASRVRSVIGTELTKEMAERAVSLGLPANSTTVLTDGVAIPL